MGRFAYGGRKLVQNQLAKARTEFEAALSALGNALRLADELQAPAVPTQLEEARMDGWLAAIQAVSLTRLLDPHAIVRAALVEELEHGLQRFCDTPQEAPPASDAVDPHASDPLGPTTRAK